MSTAKQCAASAGEGRAAPETPGGGSSTRPSLVAFKTLGQFDPCDSWPAIVTDSSGYGVRASLLGERRQMSPTNVWKRLQALLSLRP